MNLSETSNDTISYINELKKKVTEQEKALREQQMRIDKLQEMLAKSQKALYGQSSEKSRYVLGETDQLSLFNEAELETQKKAEEPTAEQVISFVRKPKRTKEEIAKDLPVVEVVCDLKEEENACVTCGSELRVLGKEEVRTELVIIPAQMRVLKYVRLNYVCTDCEKQTGFATIMKAPVPAPVMKHSLASPSSVAHVMYQKYVNAVPLYRQEKDWANMGFTLGRNTLANWIIRPTNDWLVPLYERMKKVLLQSTVIHADETVVQVLKEKDKSPSSESRMWVYCSGSYEKTPMVLYEYQPTRSGEHARRFLNGFTGFLQTDGFLGYAKVQNVTHCGCWAHLRRKFQDAMPKTDCIVGSSAAKGYEYCNTLFAIEKEISSLSANERHIERQKQSKPVLDAFWSWVQTVSAVGGSKLAEAITYSVNQQKALCAFMENGNIELSNNRAENAIRPFVIGRKNWLFSDTVRGADASAVVYSIVESAKLNDLNIYGYLLHLLTALPSIDFKSNPQLLDNLLPWAKALPDICKK